jgi:CheY-like chemotaxis protein
MKHILVIDDESQIRTLLRKMLEREGHTVTEAADGVEGLKRYHSMKPDLVITDLTMPEKNGIETIKELMAENPAVRIIAISGGGQRFPEYFLEKASVEGAMILLKKPFRNDELLTAVAQALA